MKKLTTMIALALVLTIGGVYAGWTYFQGSSNAADLQPRIGMAGISYDGAKGTISGDTSAITLMIDDMSTVAGSGISEQHVAGIVGSGSIAITFAPKAGADETVKTNGIKMTATIQVTKVGTRQWDGKDILSVDSANATITLNGGAECLSTTIAATEIVSRLVLCEGETVKLDTKADYDAFQAALSDYQIHILISEA